MNEFAAGFTDAYRDDLAQMLDLGEELSLVHTPDVSVSGIPARQDLDAEFYGKPVQSLDPETPEGMIGRTKAKQAVRDLGVLDAVASMYLYAAALHSALPEGTVADLAPEQEAFSRDLLEKVHGLIGESYHTYSKYQFISNRTDELITATSARIVDENQKLIARELDITIGDDFLEKTLTVSELPTSFEGERVFTVRQAISPAKNETVTEAAHLFQENGSPEDMDILMDFYFTEVRGVENTTVEGLVARYQDADRAARLRAILAGLRLQAAGVRESNKLALSNPDVTLPSAAELHEYQSLLDEMRA
jgi:hypothetical protein